MHYVCSAKKPSSTIMKMLVGNGARLDIEDQVRFLSQIYLEIIYQYLMKIRLTGRALIF